MRRLLAFMAVAVPLALLLAVLAETPARTPDAPATPRADGPAPPSPGSRPPARTPRRPAIRWRASRSVGAPTAGSLVRGVRLPAEGAAFVTWDPVRKRTPNRPWRRHGHDDVVRTVLRVLRRFAARHPRAPRVLVGDLSRPRGGDFGVRFGPVGHVSHQNGLDVDVYFPRRDRRERAPRRFAQVDRRLGQQLVDAFVRAGAARVLVGPSTGFTGPPRVVHVWPNHDDHLHARFADPG